MEKSLVDEHSKDEDKALKMTKTVTLAGNSFAAVYYQNMGAKAQALNVTEPYGVRLTVYSENAVNGGLGFKFGNVEQSEITCVQEGSEEVLTSRDLDYTGYRTYTVPFTPELDVYAVKEFQIFIWGEDSATIYISNMDLIYTGESTGEPEEPEPPQRPDLGEHSLMLSSFEESDFSSWSKSGQSGTVYKTERNTDKTYVKDGESSLRYTWENPLYAFGWTETYLDVSDVIERNKDAGLTGLSFEIYNTSRTDARRSRILGEGGGGRRQRIRSGSRAARERHGARLHGWRTVEIPFSAFTPERLASYTPDENGKFDADQLAFVKIGIWSNSKEVVDVEFYLDSLKLHAENALDDGSEPVTPPTDPEEKGCKGCNSSLTAVGGAAAAVSALGAAAFMLVRRKRRER